MPPERLDETFQAEDNATDRVKLLTVANDVLLEEHGGDKAA